jgi:hypothetical protein
MNQQFDIRGNLLAPPNFTDITWGDFESYFVTNQSFSSTRKSIFEEFELFLSAVRELWPKPFVLWVNGSFISQKSNPNDIDVLVEIAYSDNEVEIVALQQMIRRYRTERQILVDCYALVAYPKGHDLHSWYQSDYVYWLNQWGFTRPNRQKQKFRKGILRLNIEK